MRNPRYEAEAHARDVAYYEAHYSELLARYNGQWIAILDGKVVVASHDAFQLIAQLKACGFPANRVLRRHMTKDAELFIPPFF